MIGRFARWRRRPPVFPMTIAGYGRVQHAQLGGRARRRLAELAGSEPAIWGFLLVADGRAHRWTLYSPDPDYTQMFAPTAHTLQLDSDVFTAKFPCWNDDWTVP